MGKVILEIESGLSEFLMFVTDFQRSPSPERVSFFKKYTTSPLTRNVNIYRRSFLNATKNEKVNHQ